MTDGYEAAKGQRNWLERLQARIPGFGGFADRELRRDVDRLQREHMAGALRRIKDRARERAREYTDAGRIGELARFERLDRRLDGLAQSIRFADYGATGLFDPVKIGEPELARLYEHDLAVLDDVAALERQVEALPAPGAGDSAPALDAALEQVRTLEARWSERETVIGDVVQTTGGR